MFKLLRDIIKVLFEVSLIVILVVLTVSVMIEISYYIQNPTVVAKPNIIKMCEYIIGLPLIGDVIKYIGGVL